MIKPILFKTDMVQAILDGRKTVTRRKVKNPAKPPCLAGDILYVRETWNYGYIETSDIPESSETWFEPVRQNGECGEYIKALSRYFYKADVDAPGKEIDMIWRPSIHMPKSAARIWLKVTDVRMERLRDCVNQIKYPHGKDNTIVREGFKYTCDFIGTWNNTIKKSDIDLYGWDANPWVWVIEFERCEKPEDRYV